MEPDDEGARRGRPVDPYVDEALRVAALEVLSESGWRGATIERIAERAGVARTTIYRRHGSVHGIMLLLMGDMYLRAPVVDTGSLRGDLVAIMTAMARLWRNPGHVDFLCALVAAQREKPELGEAYRAQFKIRREDTAQILRRAKKRGELRDDVDATLLLDLLSGILSQRVLVTAKGISDEDARTIVDTILPSFLAVNPV